MNKIDFDIISRAINAEQAVPTWLPDGTRRGSEWIARNPTRADNKPGSFSINMTSGKWSDFATGDEGGDLVSLYAYLFHANDNGRAARELAEQYGVTIDAGAREHQADEVAQIKERQPAIIMPVPDGVPDPDFFHFKFGEPSAVWPYYDGKGRLLLYVCRFDHEDGKDVVPLSWCDHPGKPSRWTWRGVTGTAKRPLYGQDRLAALPDADVLIVEGEKTADAAQRLMVDQFACVAWLGGTSTADKINLKPLHGRRVVLWPDFDSQREKLTREEQDAGVDAASKPLLPVHEQPGTKAMLTLAKALRGYASDVVLVGYTPGDAFAPGWDLADAEFDGWPASNVWQYLELHGGDPWHVAAGDQAPAPQPADNDNSAPAPAPAHLPLTSGVNPFGFPHLSDKGQPINSVENLAYLMAEYGITARYNVISKDVEINIPGRRFSQDNNAAACLSTISSLCARNRMPRESLADYVTLIADANPYNPAAEWIESAPWDGVDRIKPLAASLDPVDVDMAEILLRRWMIGAVSAAFDDNGFSMQGVLVLQGDQAIGKTTWFWSLLNGRRRLGKEGAMLNPADRDSVKTAISYWLVELGELDATFRKADIAALKAFITRDQDELFLRYSRAASLYPRRTAFFASVNDRAYLRDETGNRRYWTIQCGGRMDPHHGIDMQQAWSQVRALQLAGERHRLAQDELDRLNNRNLDHMEISPVEELLRSRFDWDQAVRTQTMTATDVLIAIGYDRPNRQQARECSAMLKKLSGSDPRKYGGKLVFDLPPDIRPGRPPDYGNSAF